MTNKNVLYLLIALTLISCDPLGHHECVGDSYAHDFTDTELEWFSYEIDDTLYFLNMITGDTNYVYCAEQEIKDDSETKDDRDCEDGFRTKYYQTMSSLFHTNISNFKDNNHMDIDMECSTAGEQYLRVMISLHSQNPCFTFSKRFDNIAETLESYTQDGSPYPIPKGNISIQGKEYLNVWAIPNKIEPTNPDDMCYDTIYYNKDGFLKFISSQYGYRLERLP